MFKLTRLSEDDLYIKYEEITFLEKERVFDRCKNLKLKVHDAETLTYFVFCFSASYGEFPLKRRKALY